MPNQSIQSIISIQSTEFSMLIHSTLMWIIIIIQKFHFSIDTSTILMIISLVITWQVNIIPLMYNVLLHDDGSNNRQKKNCVCMIDHLSCTCYTHEQNWNESLYAYDVSYDQNAAVTCKQFHGCACIMLVHVTIIPMWNKEVQ